MKFSHSKASIATYVLFPLLCMALFINASKEEQNPLINASEDKQELYINASEDEQQSQQDNTMKRKRKKKNEISNLSSIIAQNLQQDDLQQPPVKLLHSIHVNTISTIVEFLTIHEILTLRKTCIYFQMLIFPNEKNMVTFCKAFGSKKMDDDITLLWDDLKYFLNESYASALKNLEILNLKQNQYTVFTHDQKIISWQNKQALHLYPKMILNKISQKPLDGELVATIYTEMKTAWAKITNNGNIITSRLAKKDSYFILQTVKMIASTFASFAALSKNGSVFAWGEDNYGGQIPELIQTKLHQNVKKIVSNDYAFAALLKDGSVVAWGKETYGGKIPELIQTKLQKVKMIFSTSFAFAALLENGNIVTWGSEDQGGKIPENQFHHQNVKMIFSTIAAFAAILEDRTVITWGDKHDGGEIPEQIPGLLHQKVKTIFHHEYAFVAVLENGSVVAWGREDYGGQIPQPIKTQLHQNVQMIFSTSIAFAALLKNGNVVAWGDPDHGGEIPLEIRIEFGLKKVKAIFSSFTAFAALFDDGEVLAWGNPKTGGRIPEEMKSKKIKMIFPQRYGFQALCENGKIIGWGRYDMQDD